MNDLTTVIRSHPAIPSPPEFLTDIGNSFEKMGYCTSTSKLAIRLQAGRRHSVNVPCASSHGYNPIVVYLGTHSALERHCNEDIGTRETYLPSLQRARQRGHDSPAFNAKINTKKCNTWIRHGSTGNAENTPPVDPISLPLPEIKRKPRAVSRRHTLSVITENVDFTEVVSVSSRAESNDENSPLPQITQTENHNRSQQRFRCMRAADTGVKISAVGNKIPGKHDRAKALQKHIEKAEDRYRNGQEMKAARLFEWLKDQTDSDEKRLLR